MRLGIHAVAAKLGGAVTYLTNVVPELVRQLTLQGGTPRVILWHEERSADAAHWPPEVELRAAKSGGAQLLPAANPLGRLWFDQVVMPREAREERLNAVFATANFCSLMPTCRQVLLVRNTVPFDRTYLSRVPYQARLFLGLQRALIVRSMAAADVVLFPSTAMRDLAAEWADAVGNDWRVAPYGSRPDLFHPGAEQERAPGKLRILHVSSYSDQKNIGTLLRAVDVIDREHRHSVFLQLTAGFDRDWYATSPLFPNFTAEQGLFRTLESRGVAADAGVTPHQHLPDLYRSSDLFVFPSYTESFGHPLIEAMASGLPILAADTPVNRELCGEAAMYVPAFDVHAWEAAIHGLGANPGQLRHLAQAALARAARYTWARHVTLVTEALAG